MPIDPKDAVAILLGIAGAKSGNPTGINTFMQREQQAQQMQMQQEAQRRQAEMQQAQLANMQTDNDRQSEQMRMQFLEKFRAGLQDPNLTDPDAFLNLATMGMPNGMDAGALRRIAGQVVPPTERERRKALKRVAKIESDARYKSLAGNPEFAGQIFEDEDGTRLTYAEWKARAGQTGPVEGSPSLPVKAETEAPLDRQALDALKRGDADAYKQILKVKTDMDSATRDPRDPVLAEIAKLRLDQMRNTPAPSLPPATQRRVDAKSRAFESLPVVKTVQKQAEAVSFANGLDPNTTNPADDQALIYSFAKAMDPDSVVREGEYATVQKYSQSWAERFGFDVTRLFSNTQFLTPQARQNMKTTIQARYAAGKQQYDNVRKSYVSQINKITGSGDGESYLTDYGSGFPEDAPADPNTQSQKLKIGRFDVVVK